MPPLSVFRRVLHARAPRALAAVLLSIAFAGALAARGAGTGSAAPAEPVQQALDAVFAARGVDHESVVARTAPPSPGRPAPVELTVELPERMSYANVNAAIAAAVETRGGRVIDVVEKGTFPDRPESLELSLGTTDVVTHHVTLTSEQPFAGKASGAPRIALVFDDLGYTTDGLARELLDLDVPLTFAVLPDLPHTADFVRAARAHGHEVILHLPMEPVDEEHHDPGRNAIRVESTPAENRRRLTACLDGVPDYVGISNHMGSRATASTDVMDLVLAQVHARDRGLFFLDSATTPFSVVPERARAAGVRVVSNNLFLDGSDEAGVLATVQTERLEAIARRRGHAVGIGHVREATVAAVEEAVGRWEADGIRLVHVSELAGPGRPTATESRALARR